MSLEEEEVIDPLASLVKLVSAEGSEFIITRECAMASGTIRAMLTGPGQWKEQSGPMPTIHFETISAAVLETSGTAQNLNDREQWIVVPRLTAILCACLLVCSLSVCQYFHYKQRYDHTPPPLPPFKLETEAIVKLLLAANFLDC